MLRRRSSALRYTSKECHPERCTMERSERSASRRTGVPSKRRFCDCWGGKDPENASLIIGVRGSSHHEAGMDILGVYHGQHVGNALHRDHQLHREACQGSQRGFHRGLLKENTNALVCCTTRAFTRALMTCGRAISREKQLKGWRREKKVALIEKTNPHWQDLSENWGKRMIFPGESGREEASDSN